MEAGFKDLLNLWKDAMTGEPGRSGVAHGLLVCGVVLGSCGSPSLGR